MADVTNYTIENASGANVRIDLNNVFAAIQSSNSKSSDLVSSQCVAGMPFLNTTSNILKIRNSSNNAFTEIGNIDSANLGLLLRSGGTMTGAISGIQFGNNADANYNKLTNLTDGSSDQDAVAFTQLRTPANTQTGTTYTLVLADARKTVRLNNASTVTVTVPKSIFAAGDVITLFRKGAGGVTITPVDSDVTINSVGTKRKLASQYSAATLICVTGGGTPEFDLIGDLTT